MTLVQNSKIIATVKSGTPVTISDIPVGTTYTVTETAVPAGANGNIPLNSTDSKTGTVGRLDAETASASDSKDREETISNTRKLGNLQITKTVDSPVEADKTGNYKVTVTLKTRAGRPVKNYGPFTVSLQQGTSDAGAGTGSASGGGTNLDDLIGAGGGENGGSSNGGSGSDGGAGDAGTTGGNSGNQNNSQSTYGTAETNAEGVVQFTPAEGTAAEYINLSNGDTISINGIPTDVVCDIREEDYSKKFATEYNPVAEGQENAGRVTIVTDATYQESITNTRRRGGLEVSKSVVSAVSTDAEKAFTFTVTLDKDDDATNEIPSQWKIKDADYTGEGSDVTVTFNNNVATFNLTSGQKAVIKDLPADIKYTVTETPSNDYTTVPANCIHSGSIGDSTAEGYSAASAPFTNTRKTGELTIKKSVARQNAIPGDNEKGFDFTLNLTGPGSSSLDGSMIQYCVITPDDNGDIIYPGADSDKWNTLNGNSTSIQQTIQNVCHNQVIAVKGLPVGTTYTVSEASNADFSRVFAGGDGNNSDGNATGTIDRQDSAGTGGEKDEIICTNTRNTGSLKISKTVDSPVVADRTGDYSFTVKLTRVEGTHVSDAEDTVTITYSDGRSQETKDISNLGKKGTVSFNITIKGSGDATVSGIPYGVAYEVTETTPSNFQEPVPANCSGTMNSDSALAATVANTHKKGKLRIDKKVVSSVTEDASKPFTFTLALRGLTDVNGNKLDWNEITIKKYNSGGTEVTPASVTSDPANATATFTLTDGQYIEFDNLPVGVGYTVTETLIDDFITINGPSMSQLSETPGNVYTDNIKEGSNTAAFRNTRRTGELVLNKIIKNALPDDLSQKFFTYMVKLDRKVTGQTAEHLDASNTSGIRILQWNGTAYAAPTVNWAFAVDSTDGEVITADVSVSPNQSVKIIGIPVGTNYSVEETKTPEENIPISDTHTASGKIEFHTNESSEIVIDNGAVTFTNTRKTNELKIKKAVASPLTNERTASYQIHVTLDPLPVDPEDHKYTISADGDLGIAEKGSVSGGKVTFSPILDSNNEPTGKGEATIYIKGSQTVTITGIPTDVTYKAEEVGHSEFDKGYSFLDSNNTSSRTSQNSAGGNNGYIQDKIIADTVDGDTPVDKSSSVSITNTRKKGELTVEKNVISAVEKDKAAGTMYQFTLTLNNLAGATVDTDTTNGADNKITVKRYTKNGTSGTQDNSFEYSGTLGDNTYTFTPEGILKFKLAHNQYVVIDNLPEGVTYTVTEDNTTSDNITTTCEKKQGDITTLGNGVTFTDGAGINNKITQVPSTVTYTNTRKTGSIKINKELLNAIPDDDQDIFYFDVTLERTGDDKDIIPNGYAPITVVDVGSITQPSDSAPSGSHPLYYTYDSSEGVKKGVIHNVPVKVTYTATTSTENDVTTTAVTCVGNVEITGIPVGTAYSIQEQQTGFWENKVRTSLPPGNINRDNGSQTGTVADASQSYSTAFTNRRDATGSLEIKKQVVVPEGKQEISSEMTTEKYRVVVTLKSKEVDGEFVKGIQAKLTYSPDPENKTGEVRTFATGSEIIEIKHDQTVTITGIPTDVTYEVTEPGYTDRFTTTFKKWDGSNYEDSVGQSVSGSITATGQVDKTRITNTRRYHNLKIRKNVTGGMGNRNEDFNFTLNINAPDDRPYTISGYQRENESDKTISKDNSPFVLMHNKDVEIFAIPSGSTVQITENRGVYTTTWALSAVGKNDLVCSSTSGTTLDGTSTASFTLIEDEILTVTNNLNPIAPTNKNDNTRPFAAAGLAALAVLVLGYIKKRRKRSKPFGSGPEGGGVL